MEKEEKTECCKEKMFFRHHHHHDRGGGGAIYGLGVIGALFYFLQGATTFVSVAIDAWSVPGTQQELKPCILFSRM